MGLFNGSNIGDSEDRTFIKQDTKQLFNNTGYLRKFANTVTETGARFPPPQLLVCELRSQNALLGRCFAYHISRVNVFPFPLFVTDGMTQRPTHQPTDLHTNLL